jgi:hypothetical protein
MRWVVLAQTQKEPEKWLDGPECVIRYGLILGFASNITFDGFAQYESVIFIKTLLGQKPSLSLSNALWLPWGAVIGGNRMTRESKQECKPHIWPSALDWVQVAPWSFGVLL